MKKRRSETGFSVVEILIIILVILLLGVAGYFVWHRNQHKSAQTNKTPISKAVTPQPKVKNILSLADGSVKFALPDTWTFVKGVDDCLGNVTADVTCLEGAVITPGENLPTQYGNGTEDFHIGVSVFDNPQQSDAQTWIEKDYTEGIATGSDVTSHTPINGYNAYYWKKAFGGEGANTADVYYVFSSGTKAVLIYARTYDPGVLNDGTQAGDFRKFESGIDDMAKTVQIEQQ